MISRPTTTRITWSAVAAAGLLLSASPSHGAVVTTDVTPDFTALSPATTSTALTSITDANGDVHTALVGPTQAWVSTSVTTFRGADDNTPFPTGAESMLGNDITTGFTGSTASTVIRVLFAQAIVDLDDRADVFLFELDDNGNGENFINVRAIIGGTLEAPVYAAATLASIQPKQAAEENAITVDASNASLNIGFGLAGIGLDLSNEFGVTQVLGLEFKTDGKTDPVAVLAVIPEPATGLLIGGLLAALAMRRPAD